MRCVALLVGALFASGCVRFEPKPLLPDQTADRLESRSLTNLELKTFLETNSQRELTNWPAVEWDLDLLTLAAFYYHPSLEVARADWQVASAGIKTAAGRPNPTVTASAAFEPARDAFSPWIPGIVFDLPVETAGKRRLRTQHSQQLSDAARYNLATTAWQVRSGLRGALVDLSAAQLRLDLLQHQSELRDEIAKRLDAQFRAGAISGGEVNSARLAAMRTRVDVAEARRTWAEAIPRLSSAIGVSAAAVDSAQFRFDLTAVRSAEALTSGEARRMALLGRADILSALAEYAASQSALQLEVAKQYPDVHLAPGYSWNAGSSGEHDWQLGATVELPLLNRNEGPIAEAAARRNASAARFLALQAKVIGQIDAAIASYRASRSNLLEIEAFVGAQRAQHSIVQLELRAGAADKLQVLATELELNTALVARIETQLKLQQALGLLEDAVQHPFLVPGSVFEFTTTNALK